MFRSRISIFHYSPSVKGLPLFIIAWLTTKLALVTLKFDFIQLSKTCKLWWMELDFNSSTAFFPVAPVGSFSPNGLCFQNKYLSNSCWWTTHRRKSGTGAILCYLQ